MTMNNTTIPSIDGSKLKVRVQNSNNSKIALILCHGFTGNGFGPFSDPLSDILSKKYLVCRFDFRGQGDSGGSFFDSSITRELEDLECIVQYIQQTYSPDKIILVGHSFGAAIAVLYAAEHHAIAGVISISGEGDLKKDITIEFSPTQHEDFEKTGKTEVVNWSKEGKLDTLGRQFLDDMKIYSTLDAIKKLSCPIIFIHGSDDDVLPFERSEEMFSLAKSPKQLVKIEDADHCFNVYAEYTKKPSKIKELADTMLTWLNEFNRNNN